MTYVVRSLLENDLYKFTMWQALLHSQPAAHAEYQFVCRSSTAFPLAELKTEVERELQHLCSLRFSAAELDYLRGLRFMKSDFIDFLSLFHFQTKFIEVSTQGEQLSIVARGPQVHIMAFEIFVLYIVNELYSRRLQTAASLVVAQQRLEQKLSFLESELAQAKLRHPFELTDFGLRRRFSGTWHDQVVQVLQQRLPEHFKGTSNVYQAMQFGLVPMGTMAHEYLQSYQAFGVRLRDSQKAALEAWVQEYRGDLGIALTDVVGMRAFLNDFDLYFAKLFDGLRHDSGDPVAWGEAALAHYQHLRIDSHSKRLVFSDGLDFAGAIKLYRHFADRVMTGFGIGTNLSNDTDIKPLNIVMKITQCNGQPVAKISDSPGKTLCQDQTYLAYLRQVFQIDQAQPL